MARLSTTFSRVTNNRFLTPEIISKISSLELLARTVVEGFISGLHRSPYLGFSIDFAEYRQYMPGDDIRYLDWKLFARTDRFYIKKFEGDTNTACFILLDASASMGYTSGKITKLEYGSYLAASLAYLANRQQDGVGFISFDEKVIDYIPAKTRPGHLSTILHAIEKTKLGKQTSIAGALHSAAEIISKRSIVVLITDLYEEPDAVLNGLKHLGFRGNDVILFHLLDEYELSFPFDQPVRLEDPETKEEIHVVPEYLREEYLKVINEHIQRYKDECAGHRIDYCMLNTSKPLDFALYSYLSMRAKSSTPS